MSFTCATLNSDLAAVVRRRKHRCRYCMLVVEKAQSTRRSDWLEKEEMLGFLQDGNTPVVRSIAAWGAINTPLITCTTVLEPQMLGVTHLIFLQALWAQRDDSRSVVTHPRIRNGQSWREFAGINYSGLPSTVIMATVLEQLKALTVVVADTGDFEGNVIT
ncbi:hypothetical protein C0Q70_11348 [Pomacea canaliculata]|uniref:Uncharacterized protein n=1 Tax=Pomacea canaliculata TaxID=400727 RepID=A0A2T7P5T7_POMCA|nr:hypothetical protein C0Q70_11348 [Pomacea canaliculata]